MSWIRHEWLVAPQMAPAALVWVTGAGQRELARVDSLFWEPGLTYRPWCDHAGFQYISRDGLETWAQWVGTAVCGCCAQQFEARPVPGATLMWVNPEGLAGRSRLAPQSHAHPGPWRGSLYKVWGP
ncbi:hypothetical protein [Thioalkalivibrio sp. ALMg9]|uniref:hypothetical protein n=1 Tax=Thioalkalivibrio sp. ALMg9 TaxID=1266912 RepID=UPI00036A2FFD|nr:hypothetical protein [Thioalkalivibrio sp. ALMg9]